MNTITARPNQTTLDVIISACGTLEGGMQMMMANDAGIGDVPEPQQNFSIPATINIDAATLLYLQQNSIVPGTGGN